MRFLRTNTAVRVTVGPFLDKTDGVTPETALTVTNCKLTLLVDDANVPTLVLDTNPTASGGANDMVHVTGDDAGFYDLELAAANVNYLGRAMLALTDAANHCPVFHEFMILPAMIYDSLVLGTDRFDTNVTHVADTAQTAGDICGKLGTPSNLGGGATIAQNLSDIEAQTDDIGAAGAGLTAADDAILTILGTPAGASMSADIAAAKAQTAAIETDTQDIQSRLPAALTAGGNMKSDALAISGDTTAADNLEAALDGTGGVTLSATITAVSQGVTLAANAVDAAAVAADAGAEIAAALLDLANGVETSVTVRKVLRLLAAALGGKSSGLDVGTPTYRDIGDTKDVIASVADADGNRSSVTLDLT